MKTKCMRQLLATLLITLPVLSWQDSKKHDDWKRDDKRELDCPIVKPVCPLFNGSNGFEVTSDGDDENDPTLRRAITLANESTATKCDPFVIVFDLDLNDDGVAIISITQELPKIKKPVCINGFTNNQASESKRDITVVVAQCQPGQIPNGLTFDPTAVGSTVKGLSIVGFSDNNASAILMRASCSLIAGNNIGNVDDSTVDCNDGSSRLTENYYGITVEAAECVTVGGLCPNERNIISGNTMTGIRILGNKVTVVGNYVGTDVWGILSRPNNEGITVDGNCNTIGCKKQCGGNLVSAHFRDGIDINGSYNKVANNIIGLDRFGKHDLANNGNGVTISGTYNTVSWSTISANADANVSITGSFNAVICSTIGTDPKGSKAFFSEKGIELGGTDSNGENKTTNTLIKNNLITVRSGVGISVSNASSTVIEGNRIGGNCSESCSLGQTTGIQLESEPCFDDNGRSRPHSREIVTGTCKRPCGACDIEPGCCPNLPLATQTVGTCIKKNTILGNVAAGILVRTSVRFTTIEDNFIGITKSGCFVGNGYGILFAFGAQNNKVHHNVIAGNQFAGVAISGIGVFDTTNVGETRNNALTKNAIFGNCGSGIRLYGGGNDCLGAPLITEAVECDEHLDVTIPAASLPENVPFTVELYGNKNCRKCVSEGQIFLCCKTVKEPLTEDLKLRVKLDCPKLKFVTATVTELTSCFAGGNTSEYSCPVKIVLCPPAPSEEGAQEVIEAADTRGVEQVSQEESKEVRQIKSKLAQLLFDY